MDFQVSHLCVVSSEIRGAEHFLRKLPAPQFFNMSFMKPEASLSSSQSPPLDPLLSQMNPVHILKLHFFKIQFNIILPSTPKSTKCYIIFPSGFRIYVLYSSCVLQKSRDSSVGIATRLGAGPLGFQGSIPGGGWEFFSSSQRPERLWGLLSLLSNGYQGLFPWG
jgi:hypothetical protein